MIALMSGVRSEISSSNRVLLAPVLPVANSRPASEISRCAPSTVARPDCRTTRTRPVDGARTPQPGWSCPRRAALFAESGQSRFQASRRRKGGPRS
jgi:hypothetical protein